MAVPILMGAPDRVQEVGLSILGTPSGSNSTVWEYIWDPRPLVGIGSRAELLGEWAFALPGPRWPAIPFTPGEFGKPLKWRFDLWNENAPEQITRAGYGTAGQDVLIWGPIDSRGIGWDNGTLLSPPEAVRAVEGDPLHFTALLDDAHLLDPGGGGVPVPADAGWVEVQPAPAGERSKLVPVHGSLSPGGSMTGQVIRTPFMWSFIAESFHVDIAFDPAEFFVWDDDAPLAATPDV